ASSENRAVELREIFLAAELGGGRVVETTQAWGSIGRGYRHFFSRSDPADLKEGFDNYVRTVYADLEAAVAAYRKAKELDPDNAVTRQNLAILLEHDREGFRYGPQANLDEAIAEYRSLREELDETGLDENLLIALARSHRFEECTDFAREIDLSPNGYGMLLVAIAATDGPDAAIEEALKLHDRGQRHVALQTAGWVLAVLRRYPESARLLTAAARGAPNAAEILSQADLIRRTRRYEELTLAVGDPRSLVPRTVIALVCAERPDDLLALFGRRLTEARRTEEETAEWEELSNGFRALLQASGMSREAVLDIMLAGLKTTAEGDDSVGYRLRVRWSLDGDESGVLFVGREDGEYRILATDQSLEPIGGEVLRWLEEGEPAAARQWLDWARDETPLPSGDDPFEGSAFPRFWTRGSDGGADEIRYAAASLHADGGEAESAIPILQQGRERAVSDAQRRNFDLALARGFSRLERHTDLLPIARGWLAAKPDSAAAFSYLREALSGLEQGEELRQAAEERLELLPDDPAAIRTLARLAEEQGDLERADRLRRRLVASATAGADDLNHLALNALFQGHVTEQTIEDAQQAAALSQHQDAAYLRTLASIYAEMGKATEAREVILHAMTIGLYDEPKPDDWYVFGRIAEHYGVADAAAQAYRKVEAPERAEDFLSSTYRVAQRRLTALAGELQGESSAERVLR
ncbi:MAG: hypothetical protein GY856_12490, partial [bacterium]|nr:hypothetical protein [bacterium]